VVVTAVAVTAAAVVVTKDSYLPLISL